MFPAKQRDPEEARRSRLQRTTANEYAITENFLKGEDGEAPVSPERIHRMLKALPPFKSDDIPQADIDDFQKKGLMGWNYLTWHIFNSNKLV